VDFLLDRQSNTVNEVIIIKLYTKLAIPAGLFRKSDVKIKSLKFTYNLYMYKPICYYTD